jgi:hypothetical protein
MHVWSTFSERPFIFLSQSIVFGARHGQNGMTTEFWESRVILRLKAMQIEVTCSGLAL